MVKINSETTHYIESEINGNGDYFHISATYVEGENVLKCFRLNYGKDNDEVTVDDVLMLEDVLNDFCDALRKLYKE